MPRGKIKEFFITTSENENQTWFAGSVVEGKVIIALTNSKKTNGPLRIILTGRAKIHWGWVSVCSDEHNIFDDVSVHLWGTGSETLASGKHEFPYMFYLPDYLPSSHEDVHGCIQYTLTAILPTRKSVVMTRQKTINVHGVVDIDRPELLNPLFDSDRKTLCCLYCTSAPIELLVEIDKGGYICGEKIVIKEQHRCRRLTNVNAALLRTTYYQTRNPNQSTFSYKRVTLTSDFSTVAGTNSRVAHLAIPNHNVSINCNNVFRVSYFVVVTLAFKLPMVKGLKVMIPITIGNMQRRSTTDESSRATTAAIYRYSSRSTDISAMPCVPQSAIMPSAPQQVILPSTPQQVVVPSAPEYPWSNALESAPMPVIVPSSIEPSAPVYPASLPLLVTNSPIQSNVETCETPPPPYSEF